MSDSYYQERARRRTRILLIAGVVAVIAVVVIAVFWSLYRDACTGSFERSPSAVVAAYLEAIGRGDAAAAQACWQHEAYYELEAGCSEICLAKVYGAQFTIVDVVPGEPYTTPEGRHNLETAVTVACTDGGETHTAQVLLDSVAGDPPWKHWTIVHSTFGGTVVEPWCKP
ncbi:MAG: hypothetical protein ACK2UA_14865 [Anaerolineae bacterium]|jgi:hypothetical protein